MIRQLLERAFVPWTYFNFNTVPLQLRGCHFAVQGRCRAHGVALSSVEILWMSCPSASLTFSRALAPCAWGGLMITPKKHEISNFRYTSGLSCSLTISAPQPPAPPPAAPLQRVNEVVLTFERMNLDNSGDCLQIFDAATANPSVTILQNFTVRTSYQETVDIHVGWSGVDMWAERC
jgi:hypothetical protein